MADISKLRFDGTEYNVKDASAPARPLGNGYSKTGTLPISSTDTISEAIGKLENNIGSGGGGGAVNTVYVGTTQYPPDSNGKVSLPAYPTKLPANGGTASNVSGTVAIANGGTGAKSASSARSNLGLGSAATKSSTTSVTSESSSLVTSGGVYSSLAWNYATQSYTSQAANAMEYSGLSFTVPAGHIYEFHVLDGAGPANPTGIGVCDSNTNYNSNSTIIAENMDTQSTYASNIRLWARQLSGVTVPYDSDVTYYVWVKRSTAASAAVRLLFRKIYLA